LFPLFITLHHCFQRFQEIEHVDQRSSFRGKTLASPGYGVPQRDHSTIAGSSRQRSMPKNVFSKKHDDDQAVTVYRYGVEESERFFILSKGLSFYLFFLSFQSYIY
jgi:hypothetical protein